MPTQGVTAMLFIAIIQKPRVVNIRVHHSKFLFYTLFIYMDIKLNNQKTSTTSCNLQELAQEMNLPEKGVAIAINNQMIPRAEWADTPVTEGADIVIIKAACGG